ncbi:MAG TPA: GNAT family N-acetyltransferase [Ktedonobacteraceae bacterium]|nr:GNAT family N-acetyltransferase [Ktedonobacteraceae bacterium]
MQTETTQTTGAPERRDLGNGLVLRWSTADDVENIGQLTSMVFRNGPQEPPNQFLADLMHHLLSGTHPLMGAGDYALVEDTHRQGNRVVACTCLWRQTWEYEGIPFRIGRPEIVATDPEYRHRGLIREIFGLVHARSAAEGHLVQAITGIPYYYRQFGYEYALDLDNRVFVPTALIPPTQEGVSEPYTLRDATAEDIGFINSLYDRQRASSVVSTRIDESWWHYQIESWQKIRQGTASPPKKNDSFWHIQMILDAGGTVQGYIIIPVARWRNSVPVLDLEVKAGVNLQAALPSILRAVHRQGQEMPTYHGAQPLSRIAFTMGRTHPVYDLLEPKLAPTHIPPYAWYVRVPDLPAFLRHIAPALEKRLAQSSVAGYSGDLKLDFYRGGLRMVFEQGCLTTVENWRRPVWDGNEVAGFPPLVFLQLLFGYRSLSELRHAFPDVWANEEMVPLLNILFPARPSWAVPLG